jgi:hypothetical protein
MSVTEVENYTIKIGNDSYKNCRLLTKKNDKIKVYVSENLQKIFLQQKEKIDVYQTWKLEKMIQKKDKLLSQESLSLKSIVRNCKLGYGRKKNKFIFCKNDGTELSVINIRSVLNEKNEALEGKNLYKEMCENKNFHLYCWVFFHCLNDPELVNFFEKKWKLKKDVKKLESSKNKKVKVILILALVGLVCVGLCFVPNKAVVMRASLGIALVVFLCAFFAGPLCEEVEELKRLRGEIEEMRGSN